MLSFSLHLSANFLDMKKSAQYLFLWFVSHCLNSTRTRRSSSCFCFQLRKHGVQKRQYCQVLNFHQKTRFTYLRKKRKRKKKFGFSRKSLHFFFLHLQSQKSFDIFPFFTFVASFLSFLPFFLATLHFIGWEFVLITDFQRKTDVKEICSCLFFFLSLLNP